MSMCLHCFSGDSVLTDDAALGELLEFNVVKNRVRANDDSVDVGDLPLPEFWISVCADVSTADKLAVSELERVDVFEAAPVLKK